MKKLSDKNTLNLRPVSSIQWPKEWNADEGWQDRESAPLTSEPRKWDTLDRQLRVTHGQSVRQRAAAMGGPTQYTYGLDENFVKNKILDYHRKHGKRPFRSVKGWHKIDTWLQANLQVTLSKYCDQLGLASRSTPKTLEGLKQELLDYYKKYGKTPSTKEGEWMTKSSWLRYNYGFGLHSLCVQLGIAKETSRTIHKTSEWRRKEEGKQHHETDRQYTGSQVHPLVQGRHDLGHHQALQG